MQRAYEKQAMQGTLHFILNTSCNAGMLKKVDGTPGVCDFCYRERENVKSSPEKIRRIFELLKQRTQVQRICFTGGDPLMPVENYAEFAIMTAKRLGYYVNMHTNGLLLKEKYSGIQGSVDVYSLAIDGAGAEMSDKLRGLGYYEIFTGNVELLIGNAEQIAFNTFVTPETLDELDELAERIHAYSMRTGVEYWLLSQYRPISRDTPEKRERYLFPSTVFKEKAEQLQHRYPSLNIYAQPTRDGEDKYPLRYWMLADGTLTVDSGNNNVGRNINVGNILEEDITVLMARVNTLRKDAALTF